MRILLVTASIASVAAAALAVRPATWTHKTEADFSAGKLEKTVVTSLGEVMLARSLETLVGPRKDLGMISAMAIDRRGRLYAAAAPSAKIYRLEKPKLVEFAALPGVLVRSMMFVKGSLLAGASGKGAGVYRIDSRGRVEAVWTDPKVTFVWSIVPGPRGSFYAATGPEGRVYHVGPDGKARVIYDSDEKNILSLAGGGHGLLYAGTGENGLIVRIDPARRTGRVLYDAAEKEISALLMDADGVLYAATSDSTKASASGEAPCKEVKGRPVRPIRTRPATGAPGGTSAVSVESKTLYEGPATPEVMGLIEKRQYAKLHAMWHTKRGVDGPPAATGPAGGADATTAPATRPAAATPRPAGSSSRPAQLGSPVPLVRRARPGGPPRPARPPTPAAGKGNAVYRIDKEGFVRTIFRRPVSVFAMALRKSELILATGHGGQMFAVDLDDDRITMLAKVDPKDVTALAAGAKGRLYLGTAGKAGLFALGRGLVGKGTCLSKVLDAKQISRWGTFSVHADVPAGCQATIATRSGNVAAPDEKTWSDFSPEMPVSHGWRRIASPAGRFLQYRLTLSGDGESTAVIDQVQLVRQADNLAPVVSAVQVKPNFKPSPPGKGAASGQPMRYRIVAAKAADPNGDTLRYAVYFRRVGHKVWIKLTEKLKQPTYPWDTLGVADGTYEVRLEASDGPANPPTAALTAARISRPVIVDNTPPRVSDLRVRPAGKGKLSLAGEIADATSRIRKIEYSVDTNDEWTVVPAKDGICDARKESFAATIDDLQPGTHRIAIRVSDEFNNTGYASVEVNLAE